LPVVSNSDCQLIVLDRLAAAAADITVYVAGIEPALGQEELELLPLLQGERGLVLRPGGLERPETAQPVGEMAYRESIAVSVIIALDHPEVAQDEDWR